MTIQKRPPQRPSVLNALFLTSILVGLLLVPCGKAAANTNPLTNPPCDLHHEACTQPLSGGVGTVTLAVSPQPVTAMTDLVFSVQIAGIASAEAPYLDLAMPGMKMGPNRVSLKPVANGAFTGNGIIVRCPSGKPLWQITVTVPGAGTAEFLVNVVY